VCSEKFMRDETKLYVFRTGYARWDEFIRVQNDLCAMRQSYAHSERVMRDETTLYALRMIYAR